VYETCHHSQEGYEYWKWRDHHIHFVSLEPESGVATKPPVVLIHGFGASAFHWRYNAPEIARAGHRVFAMDLLGFGKECPW
jgi:pimeloyl-ACP methyl ester carboxylesterase